MSSGHELATLLRSRREWTVADSTRSRHILYAILRQVYQLPDSHVRSYVRSYSLRQWRSAQDLQISDQLKHERWHTKLRQAGKKLSYLRRANCGDSTCLQMIMSQAYGRTGRRRHELLATLTQSTLASTPTSWKEKPPTLAPMLQTLLASQAAEQPIDTSRKALRPKHLQLSIPEENTWQRSFPIKRAVNKQIKWYHDLYDRAVAPLPKKEFERLVRLALKGPGDGDLPAIRHEKPREAAADLVDVLPIGRGLGKDEASRSPASPRLLKRLWGKILRNSCYMSWDEERSKWAVIWGKNVIIEHERRKTSVHAELPKEPT